MKAIGFSIDGLKDTHDSFRHVKSFDYALRALKEIQEYPDIKTTISTMIIPETLSELEPLRQILNKYKIDLFHLGPCFPIGRAAENSQLSITPIEMIDVLEYFIEKQMEKDDGKIKVAPELADGGWLGWEYEGIVRRYLWYCQAGLKGAGVSYDGKAIACASINRTINIQGDLRKKTFKEIWETEYKRYRNKSWTLEQEPCKSCDQWDLCQGGAMHDRGPNYELNFCMYNYGY